MLSVEDTASAARDVLGSAATRIRRIDVILFAQDMENVAFDVSPSGIDMPGVRTTRKRIAVRIETQDGARGEYVGGRTDTAPQTHFIAKWIIGRDCYARETIYEDIRLWLLNEDRIGGCQIDNALWDLAG